MHRGLLSDAIFIFTRCNTLFYLLSGDEREIRKIEVCCEGEDGSGGGSEGRRLVRAEFSDAQFHH